MIAFIILLATDTAIAYLSTGDILLSAVCPVAVLLIIAVMNFIELKILKTVPLNKTGCISHVTDALNSVLNQTNAKGIKPVRKNIKLYISGCPGLHSYTVGNCMVLTKDLVKSNRGILESAIAHELFYIKYKKSCFFSLVKLNIFAFLSAIIISLVGAVAVFVFMVLIVISIVSYFIVALRVSEILTDMFRSVIKTISAVFYYTSKALLSAFCRSVVYKADRFACSLDYGSYLLQLLNEQNRQPRKISSFFDDIISPCPDNFKRISRIQNYMNVSGVPQKNTYQNPF